MSAPRIARILFPLPLPEPFDYEIPDGTDVQPGSFVRAPLSGTERTGVVWSVSETATLPAKPLKSLTFVYPSPPLPEPLRRFIDRMARYVVAPSGSVLRLTLRSREALLPSPEETVYEQGSARRNRLTPARQAVLDALQNLPASRLTASALASAAGVSSGVIRAMAEAGLLTAHRRPVDLPFPVPDPTLSGHTLTGEQEAAARTLREAVAAARFQTVLIDGITGSGKTEVYFEAMAAVLRTDPDAQILVLLPEIALTQAILARFAARFGAEPAPWHSGLSEAERRRTWREVAHGRARIVVGARSALFLPFARLRLMVVDEEHDTSFKQEEGVIYHARDMAVLRAREEGALLVLASATPSLETLHNARSGRYGLIRLSARPGTARLPDISLIDLRATPPEPGTWLAPPLVQALKDTLESGEQALLFLNRRGYAPLVLCKACGKRLNTPGTESWLTEHRYTNRLICHLTGFSMPKPERCPHCSARDSLMGVGPGVERVAEEVRVRFPGARAAIFSSDTTEGADGVRTLISAMSAGQIDVLIGTQIVAKGHNFPQLTLVGVVDADAGLKGGDLRAGERTFQLLQQVAGRAGRASAPGRALIQTYNPEAPVMQALARCDRDAFLSAELEGREAAALPPFGRLAALILSMPGEADAAQTAYEIARAAPNGEGITVWGPAPAPIGLLRGRSRWRLLVQAYRGVDMSAYLARWRAGLKLPSSARLSIDIDPYSFL